MVTPSVRQFRAIVVIALLSWIATTLLPNTGVIRFDPDIANARTWNYFGSSIPFWVIQIWWGVSSIMGVISLSGMLRFWPPSRWMLAAIVAINLVLQPLIGLAVYSPLEASFGGICGTAFIWLICVSFYTPLAARFVSDRASIQTDRADQ